MHDIAGYRIVRRLSSTDQEERAIGRGTHGGVLVRRLREPIPLAVERAIEAHAAAGDRPHIVRLRDLAIEPEGALIVVTDVVAAPNLREALTSREQPWELGHAITLLVPVLRTLAELHEEGITLGRLGLDTIHLDATGAPVIADWSEAIVTPPLPLRLRERDAHYIADAAAVASLVRDVADALSPADRARLRAALLDGRNDADVVSIAGSESAERLFALADPLPLVAGVPATEPARAAAATVDVLTEAVSEPRGSEPTVAVEPLRQERAEPTEGGLRGTLVRVSAAVGLPATLVSALDGSLEQVTHSLSAIRERATRLPRRRLMGVAVAASLGLALMVTMVLDRGATGDAATTVTEAEVDDVGGEDVVGPIAADEGEGEEPSRLDLPDPQDGDWAAIVRALVEEWDRCARGDERLCESALQRDSAAAHLRLHREDEAPLTTLAALMEGETDVLITERMGAAVIVEVTAPEATAASLLLMRSEAGWRVRDVVD